jgi:hypothetical protein
VHDFLLECLTVSEPRVGLRQGLVDLKLVGLKLVSLFRAASSPWPSAKMPDLDGADVVDAPAVFGDAFAGRKRDLAKNTLL